MQTQKCVYEEREKERVRDILIYLFIFNLWDDRNNLSFSLYNTYTQSKFERKRRTCDRRHALKNHVRSGVGRWKANMVVGEMGAEAKEV